MALTKREQVGTRICLFDRLQIALLLSVGHHSLTLALDDQAVAFYPAPVAPSPADRNVAPGGQPSPAPSPHDLHIHPTSAPQGRACQCGRGNRQRECRAPSPQLVQQLRWSVTADGVGMSESPT